MRNRRECSHLPLQVIDAVRIRIQFGEFRGGVNKLPISSHMVSLSFSTVESDATGLAANLKCLHVCIGCGCGCGC